MDLCQVNPHLRFAAALRHTQVSRQPVRVTDCRIFYAVTGQVTIEIEGEAYTLQPGGLFYCCAGSTYAVEVEEGVSLLCLNFDLSQTYRKQTTPLPVNRDPAQWSRMPVYFEPVEDSSFLNTRLFLPDADSLQERLQRIVARYGADTPLDRAQSQTELKQLLIAMHRMDAQQLPPKIVQLITYIHQHYAENITNSDLAEMAGYHQYYLNRLFSACTGKSLHGFLLQVRINRACQLILSTDLDLKEIPEQVGFGSYPHFSGYFKQCCGCSPAQYRKRFRGNI